MSPVQYESLLDSESFRQRRLIPGSVNREGQFPRVYNSQLQREVRLPLRHDYLLNKE
jgi:hypothetical protein